MRPVNYDGFAQRSLPVRHLASAGTSPAPVAPLVMLAVVLFSAACSLTPEAREAKHMAKGKEYFSAKKYKEAMIEFRVASQNMPKDAEPHYQLGMTYLTAGAAMQALEEFDKAIVANPKHEGALFQEALFKVGSSKPEDVIAAKEALQKYSTAHPQDGESIGAVAMAEAKLGNKEEAMRLLRAAVSKDPSQMRPVSVIIALYAARGDADTARQIAQTVVEQVPNSPEAATLKAQVSLATNDLADADLQIARALSLKRDYQPALALRLRRELMTNNRTGAEETSQELAKSSEKRTWSAYARMLVSERKYDEAAAEFEKILKERGDPVEIRNEFSGILMTVGRRKQAGVIIDATLAKNPANTPALLQRATLRLDDGDIDGAAKDIKALITLKALTGSLSYLQSRLAAARGDAIKQGDFLADALRLNPRLFNARLDLARLLAISGKGGNALAILDAASPSEKATAEYVFHRNGALMAAGSWEAARKGVDGGLAMVRSPGFLYQDGLLKARDHDLPAARKALDESFQADPSNPLTLGLLSNVTRQQGDTARFLEMLKAAAARRPESIALQNALGEQLAAKGDSVGARAAYSAAKTAGDATAADVAISALDVRSGALDAAKQRLAELIVHHDNAKARLLLAEIETRKGSAGAAVQHYLKAIEMEPANVAAMNNLADLIAANPGTNADALFWATKALALAPDSPVVQDTVGWVYYRQGKYAEAVPFLERSLRSQERPLAHYHLAAALMKAGDTTRGRKEYDLAIKADQKSAVRAEVSPLFDGK